MSFSTTARALALFVTISLLLLGCVPTLHSILNDDDLVQEPAILGDWTPSEPDDPAPDRWRFLQDGKTYRLEHRDSKGTGIFTARLGRFNDLLVLELQPQQPSDQKTSDMHRAYLFPMRTFFIVDQLEPSLKLSILKMDWLKAHLKENPNALKHEVINEQHGTVLITASTQQIQAFITRHRGNADAWTPAELRKH